LKKSYYLSKPEDEPGLSLMFDRAEGSIIDWKEGKNLAVKVEIKKQRNKNSQKTRTVKKTVPAETFFEFFTPMTYPEDDSSQDLDEDVMERIENDYEAGEFIKEKLIPNSVGWFTGLI
jgi:nucleosome assembly protein 1-like 1